MAQEPARQRRRRRHHRRRRRRPQPQLRLPAGATTTRAPRPPAAARPTAAPAPASEPETQGARRAAAPGPLRRSWSTTTPPPSCCCTASAGRSPRRPRTTSSTRRSRATTRTRGPGLRPRPLRGALHDERRDRPSTRSSAYGTLAFTPEMSTCETASAVDPDDAFEPDDCESGFTFPDSEALVQAEFAKNLPFALAVAQSAARPGRPGVGRRPHGAGLRGGHASSVSYGDPQPVAVTARRDAARTCGCTTRSTAAAPHAHRSASGAAASATATSTTRTTPSSAGWSAAPGPATRSGSGSPATGPGRAGGRASPSRTGSPRTPGDEVLVLADEDYDGVNPTYPPSVTSPKYAATYVRALRDLGRRRLRLGRVDAGRAARPRGAGPLQDGRLVPRRQPADPGPGGRASPTSAGDPVPDAAVAERQQYLTLAVRDYLNEGGKLLHTGETAGYYGPLGTVVGGIFYGLDGAPDQDCVVTQDFSRLPDPRRRLHPVLPRRRTPGRPWQSPTGVRRPRPARTGADGRFGGPAVADNPLDEAGTFGVTSDVLPVERVPAVRQPGGRRATRARPAARSTRSRASWYVGGAARGRLVHAARPDRRPRAVRRADAPTLQAQLSFDTEPGYDNVIVEAHTSWAATTGRRCPSWAGSPRPTPPTECEAGFLLEEHPFLLHYLTPGDTACSATGTTGAWNAMTGSSGGWQHGALRPVGVRGPAGRGVDQLRDRPGRPAASVCSSTTPGSSWAATTAEARASRPGSARGPRLRRRRAAPRPARVPTHAALFAGAVTTHDTVLLGFGVEQLGSRAARAEVLGTALRHLER